MACFLVSAAEAAVVTAAAKVIEKKENNKEKTEIQAESTAVGSSHRIPFSRKLKWLSTMLWGGSALLAFEHLWHGEIVPWFPFLTAIGDSGSTLDMLHEMATVGVGMSALVTVVWLGMVAVSTLIEKKADGKDLEAAPSENQPGAAV